MSDPRKERDNMITNTQVRLIDGVLYDPWSPEGPVPSPATVAHGLAHLNRYGGHTKRPYTVAEHSLWVALYLAFEGSENAGFREAANLLALGQVEPRLGGLAESRRRLALCGLAHDAPEGCGLVDVPGPVLRHAEMRPYKQAHIRCMEWLALGWGLPSTVTWSDEVQQVDTAILGAELSIRPDNATGHDGSGENIPRWPSLDLIVKHNLARFSGVYIALLWGNMFSLLRDGL